MQMKETIRLEQDIFVPMAGSGKLYVYHTDRFWSQIKTSGYVITVKWIKRVCDGGNRGLLWFIMHAYRCLMKLTNLKLIYAIIFQYTAYFFIPKFAVSLRIFTSLWEMIQCKLYLSRAVICCHFRAAIYANRHYLALYQNWHKERLARNGELKPQIIGDVYIHPTADVHPTAVVCIWLVYASVCMHADVCKIANTLFKNYLCCTVVKISKTWL